MIRNGRLIDVKDYVDFVNAHPNLPSGFRTYYDFYCKEKLGVSGEQSDLSGFQTDEERT